MTASQPNAPQPGPHLVLVSHALCPYVQRAVIALTEKGVPFERVDIDLADKPAWFLGFSPLGKTPVLLVPRAGRFEPVFESAVICEYLDETHLPPLHPHNPLDRARHRAWIEVASATLNQIWQFYTAKDAQSLEARRLELVARFAQIDDALTSAGPWFAGERFSLVDAAFAPALRYFEVFDAFHDTRVLSSAPKVRRWASALAARASVRSAIGPNYAQGLRSFVEQQRSELGRLSLAARKQPAGAVA